MMAALPRTPPEPQARNPFFTTTTSRPAGEISSVVGKHQTEKTPGKIRSQIRASSNPKKYMLS